MTDERRLTHLDAAGRARMVDVTAKPWTARVAVARGRVVGDFDAAAVLRERDLVVRARVAGANAAKIAWDLIPLCHPIHLIDVDVDVSAPSSGGVIDVEATTKVVAPTGVEMEALTACSITGLVLVQELRHLDPAARLVDVALWRKVGGKSGVWVRAE
ncbi:MAG: cyclic pyranopterin monophosphate synthase MoaC [Actinobacteria bacterium]|nr:cyclic pyranopterin monophosphate synthase MoaC [Actinomycetota bacterium]